MIQLPDGTYMGLIELNSDRTGYHPAESFYQCKDGWLALVARSEVQAHGLATSLGLELELGRPLRDWSDGEAQAIARALKDIAVQSALELLRAGGVWVELCRTDMAEAALGDPQLLERGTVRESLHSEFGRVREIGTLYTLSRSKVGSTRPIHALDEHRQEILRELAASYGDSVLRS